MSNGKVYTKLVLACGSCPHINKSMISEAFCCTHFDGRFDIEPDKYSIHPDCPLEDDQPPADKE
jgi:hypothetical protein